VAATGAIGAAPTSARGTAAPATVDAPAPPAGEEADASTAMDDMLREAAAAAGQRASRDTAVTTADAMHRRMGRCVLATAPRNILRAETCTTEGIGNAME